MSRARKPYPPLLVGVVASVALACAARTPDRPAASPPTTLPQGRDTPGSVLDPSPGAPVCSGYAIDGVSLGMPLAEAASAQKLEDATSADRALGTEAETMVVFRASREGRTDRVRVSISSADPDRKVAGLRALIIVSKRDSWPASLFALVGNPRRVRLDEWYWWNGDCRAAMSLRRIESLGRPSPDNSYILEIKPYP